MNEKEIAEIRRRFRPDQSSITHVRGCYVNEKKEIVSQFDQSLNLMPQEESEGILATLKKTLSGTAGKNLIDITFDTKQVVDSDEHRLLMALKTSALRDESAVETFFQRVIGSLVMEGNYLILLTHDTYDVPYRSKDGAKLFDASEEVYSYVLCSVCPIKITKPALGYFVVENQFHNCKSDWIVSPPELGFIFPAFDDRSANIYNALYYTRNIGENHVEFTDMVFNTEIPMAAAEQKETFQNILGEALLEDCSFEVVRDVNTELRSMIEEHKANKETEPLTISKKTVKNILESCGVKEEHMAAFEERYDSEFGEGVSLSPRNIVDTRQLEMKTPSVKIQVNPDRTELVETRTIDGKKYILIRADEGVELNGVNLHL